MRRIDAPRADRGMSGRSPKRYEGSSVDPGPPLELGSKAPLQLPQTRDGKCHRDETRCAVSVPKDRAKHVGDVEQHQAGQA